MYISLYMLLFTAISIWQVPV